MSYELNRLKFIAHFSKGKILDCGYSQNPNPFLKGEIIGVDIQKCDRPINYRQVKVLDLNKNLPFKDQSFDTLIAGEVLEHLENPSRFFKEVNRVLKKEGIFLLTIPNVYYWKEIFNNIFSSKKLEKEHLNNPTKNNILTVAYFSGFKVHKLNYFCNSKIFRYLPYKPFFLKTTLLFILSKTGDALNEIHTKDKDLKIKIYSKSLK